MSSIRSFKLLIPVALVIAFCGCEVEGQSFKPVQLTSNRAVIYVYRPYHLMGAALEPEVTCGHSTIAIGAGGYHTFAAEPGTIGCVVSSDTTSSIQFEARPETEYFIREDVAPGVSAGAVTLTRVDRSTGLLEIDGCKEQ
ncbi:MAG: hypothetical protein ACLQDV_13275 [Candidatus Binataceae bacterium]